MAIEFGSRKETFENFKVYETMLAGRPFKAEMGKMCGLSNASALIRYGETCVMCNVVMSPKPREGVDFFPLNVEYEEKLYAAGRIPGSFMRREGRPGERAILTSRVVDRPMRPLFPKEMRNDVCITMAAEAGQLELNAFEPIIFYCMFQSIDTLGYAVQTLVDNCIVGITANEERCRYLVENSVGIITAISPHLGYQKAADIAKKAIKTGESVRSLILKEKLMDEDELNRILDPIHMTEPGISGKDYLIKK
mgnify:CR=1 FL=1